MNPSYVRVRVPKVEALRRFATWQGLAEVGPLVLATASQATELACDDLGQWKGQAVLVSEVAAWSLFADLTGGLSAVTSASWLAFAGADDLAFAGYNDAIGYGAIVMISGGVVLQDILFDASSPETNVCVDRRPGEASHASWTTTSLDSATGATCGSTRPSDERRRKRQGDRAPPASSSR